MFERQGHLILVKQRTSNPDHARQAVDQDFQSCSDFHIDPQVLEIIALQAPETNYSKTLLTYIMCLPSELSQKADLLDVMLITARSLGTLNTEAGLIYEEMFSFNRLDSKIVGVVARDFSNFNGPSHLKLLLQEETKLEEDAQSQIGGLDLTDRKKKYDSAKLTEFVRFKNKMVQKLGSHATDGLPDNVYCRFLDGYLFNIQECETHMTNFLGWRLDNKLWTLKLEEFPEIIQKDFLKILGPDKEGRPVIMFKIKNFTSEGTTADRLALFNGVMVTKALSEYAA